MPNILEEEISFLKANQLLLKNSTQPMRRVLRITLNFQYLFEFIPNFSILDHLLGVAYIEAEESNQLEKGGLLQPHLALKTLHFCLEVALYLRERIQRNHCRQYCA
jgi:hypothetical protein